MMGERETKGRGFAFAALDRTAAVSACMSLRVCAAGRDSFRRTLFEGLDTLVSQISDTPPHGPFRWDGRNSISPRTCTPSTPRRFLRPGDS